MSLRPDQNIAAIGMKRWNERLPSQSRCSQLLRTIALFATFLSIIAVNTAARAQEKQPAQKQSSETTSGLTTPSLPKHLTGTLREINESLSKGVEPSQNFVVNLVQLFGERVFEPDLLDDTMQMLGVTELDDDAPRIVSIDAFLNTQPEADPGMLSEQLMAATSQVWTREDFPLLKAYLDENEESLDAIVRAVEQPHYYAPLLTAEQPPRLMSASLSFELRLPFIGRFLAIRALNRISENRFEEAGEDLLACHKLALKLANGSPFDVSVAKAHVIDAFAYRAETAALESGLVSADHLNAYRHALQALPVLPNSDQAADRGERAILKQEVEFLKLDALSFAEMLTPPGKEETPVRPADLARINWQAAIDSADEIQNQYVRAIREADRETQEKLFQKLDEDYAKWEETADESDRLFRDTIRKDPVAASRWIGENMARSLRPLYWQRRFTDDRARTRRQLILTGLAVAAYGKTHGAYPDSLEVLVPGVLDQLPEDPHSDEPLFYSKDADGSARIISWGTNKQDDAGKIFNDDQILKLPALGQ